MRRSYEGFGADEEMEMSDEQREFKQELDQFAELENIPGHEDLVGRAIRKIERSGNIDEQRDALSELENMLADTLGDDEKEKIAIFESFISGSAEVEEDEDTDDEEFDMAA